jgi:hypothetical protein
MKWITKIVTGVMVLALFAQKIVSPAQSLMTGLISNILIVMLLLGPGEFVITHICVWFTKIFSKTSLLTKTDK